MGDNDEKLPAPVSLRLTREAADALGALERVTQRAIPRHRLMNAALVAGAAEARANGADDRVDVGDDIARRIEASMWALYREAYLMEMRESYRRDRGPWERLLKRERVCLVCFCVDGAHCHRALLGGVILPRLGAEWCGEVTP